jgi:DNA-directed RNA polymerase specialized sigma24 family protein
MAEIDGDAWRAADAAMEAMLRSRGIDPDVAADVKQYVAVRALERDRPFVTRNGFVKWTVWVAWNRATDVWRAEQRRVDPRPVPDDVPELEHADVEERARHRVALAQVAAALARLTPLERGAALAPLRGGYRRSSAADRDRRYEARATLRRVVRDFPAVAPLWRARRLLRKASTAAALPVAAAVVLVGVSVPSAGQPRSPGAVRVERGAASPAEAGARLDSTNALGGGRGTLKRPPLDPPDGRGGAASPRGVPRVDLLVPNTPAGVHVAAPPKREHEPLLCVATFATPHACIDPERPVPATRRPAP